MAAFGQTSTPNVYEVCMVIGKSLRVFRIDYLFRVGIAISDLNFQSQDSGLSNFQSRYPIGIGVV